MADRSVQRATSRGPRNAQRVRDGGFRVEALRRATHAAQEALFDLSLEMERIDSIKERDAERIARRVVRAYWQDDPDGLPIDVQRQLDEDTERVLHYRHTLSRLLIYARGNDHVLSLIHDALDWRPGQDG